MQTCTSCGRETPAGFPRCANCGAVLDTPPDRETRKTVTILFCDIAGSTALGEGTDPEALRALLARYFERMKTIVEAIGRDRLGLQFDVYHVQVTEGDITKRMEQFMPVIAHMQIADVPARNEPGTGEIGWSYVFRRIDELGYQGWVGCEYRPAGETVAGLGWREQFGV